MTEGEICTVALGRVGEKQSVDNLTGNTTSAKLCRAVYAMARDAALEEYPWPFAARRAVLAVEADSSDDDESRATAGWTYTYRLPADLLCPRYIETGLLNPAADQQIAFSLEDDSDVGPVLLTNKQDAELVYTRKVTETGKFTPLFTDALAWRVAYELSFSLPVKPAVGERMIQMYQMKVAQAAASVFRHMKEAPPQKPSGIRARY